MYWYKVRVRQGDGENYTYVGSMEISPDELAATLSTGVWIRINTLLYWVGSEVHDWDNWDAAVEPVLYLSPQIVVSFMQLKNDPRLMSADQLGQSKKGILSRIFKGD